MVQPDRHDRQPAARRERPPSRSAGRKALSAARNWFEGSLARSFVRQLKELDFASQAMLFGAGLLVSLLPFVILLSAFTSERIDDDISLRMGLNRRAAAIVDHLFTSSPASLNAATATSLVFVAAGMRGHQVPTKVTLRCLVSLDPAILCAARPPGSRSRSTCTSSRCWTAPRWSPTTAT